MQSLRYRGGHAWPYLDKKLRIKRNKTDRMAKNARLQGFACIVRGALYIILEGLNIKSMMVRGGNHKRMMQAVGRYWGFPRQCDTQRSQAGCAYWWTPRRAGMECLLRSYTHNENRASRDEFKCGDEAHAGMNAAAVLLKPYRGPGGGASRPKAPDKTMFAMVSLAASEEATSPLRCGGRQKVTQAELPYGL